MIQMKTIQLLLGLTILSMQPVVCQTMTPTQAMDEGYEIYLTSHYGAFAEWSYNDSTYVLVNEALDVNKFLLQRDCLFVDLGTEVISKFWWVQSSKYQGSDCWILENKTKFCYNYYDGSCRWYFKLEGKRYTEVLMFSNLEIVIRKLQ